MRRLQTRARNRLALLALLAAWAFSAGHVAVAAPAPAVDEKEFSGLGFKVLVATTAIQEEWVQRLKPGLMRPMQRNGKKYFIYPDAANKRIFVGGPKEWDAYRALHPNAKLVGQGAPQASSEYRAKQADAMNKASARDLSDPFYGASWADLGW